MLLTPGLRLRAAHLALGGRGVCALLEAAALLQRARGDGVRIHGGRTLFDPLDRRLHKLWKFGHFMLFHFS